MAVSLHSLAHYTVHCTSATDKDAWNNKGTLFTELGRHKEAIKCFDKAIELFPKQHKKAEVWIDKGVALGGLGRHNDAMACFDKAIELDSENAKAWMNKGVAHDKLGEHEEALKCFARWRELE